MSAKKNFITLLVLVSLLLPIHAEEAGEAEKSVESPSPNGRYAFLLTETTDQRTLDLIEKASGRDLLQVAKSDEDSNELETEILWSPDSKRFAVTETYHNRRLNDLVVYIRVGDTFREVELPDLPEANLSEKLGHDKDHFWHMNEIDFKSLIKWTEKGSLVFEIETMIDGNDNFATAARTVVLGIDQSGHAKILSSTLKITSHIEPDK